MAPRASRCLANGVLGYDSMVLGSRPIKSQRWKTKHCCVRAQGRKMKRVVIHSAFPAKFALFVFAHALVELALACPLLPCSRLRYSAPSGAPRPELEGSVFGLHLVRWPTEQPRCDLRLFLVSPGFPLHPLSSQEASWVRLAGLATLACGRLLGRFGSG